MSDLQLHCHPKRVEQLVLSHPSHGSPSAATGGAFLSRESRHGVGRSSAPGAEKSQTNNLPTTGRLFYTNSGGPLHRPRYVELPPSATATCSSVHARHKHRGEVLYMRGMPFKK